MAEREISADFPFESRYVSVRGSKMHYIEEGSGDPILFIHGNPTSSYLWRNVIPHVAPHGRCIAVDLIGMGKSDKPEIAYEFFDHAQYLDAFIDTLELENITMVAHDCGSGLGLHHARRYPERIRAFALIEAILRPLKWSDFPANFERGLKVMRTTGVGWMMASVVNTFLIQTLPQATIRKMTPEELAYYREPYPDVASRQPVRQWPRELPIEGTPTDVMRAVEAYAEWLKTSEVPKLLLHADPGAFVRADTVKWCQDNVQNLKTVDLGRGIHYLAEDHPHEIGEAIAEWVQAFPA